MGKTYSYDGLDDDFLDHENENLHRDQHDKQKRRIKQKIDDYLERKRLRENLGDSDLDFME